MHGKKHIYYLTASDVQKVAKETISRKLTEEDFEWVVDKLLDRIEWYDPLELLIWERCGK